MEVTNEFLVQPVESVQNPNQSLSKPKPISLVTGGAGFIGSHLCESLLESGHIVICYDNFQTGSIENIKAFQSNPSFSLYEADICTPSTFPHLDYIWHLACPASPPKYQSDGYKTLQICILGTMNMIELAKTHNSKLLFTSTSEVYGDPLQHPQPEDYWGNVNNMGPRSCYDEGKRCAETFVYQFREQFPEFKQNLKIVRIFNTYGPKMDIDDGRVITNYIKSVLNEQPITIYGDGTQTRSFCYVSDMVRGLRKMMDSDENGPINLGNPNEEFSMNKLKEIFDDAFQKKLDFVYLPLPQDDPKQRRPIIKLAKEKLDWEPKVDLAEGIQNTINYFLNRR